MPPTGDEILDDLLRPFKDAMDEEKITARFLAKKLRRELSAKSSKTLKIKGAAGKLPRGFRNVVTTGIIETIRIDGDLERDYTDGESVIMWDEVDWGVQQRARIDAHKLRGDYPAEKKELSFNEATLNAILRSLPDGVREAVRSELITAISAKRD